MSTADAYTIAIPMILGLIAAEACFSAWRKRNFYNTADTFGTMGLLAGNVLMSSLVGASILVFNLYLYQFSWFNLTEILPSWAMWTLTFFAIDFVFYWSHRASHRVRLLWAVHMSHHCSEEMNFVVAFRQAWFGPISKVPFFMFLPLMGFDPTITAVAGVAATFWGVWGHTQWVGKLGTVFEFFFNTPSAHRVHHGSNPEYIDKNYGNLFMIWDRMFGTYAEENAPVRYGLINNINTHNPFKITFTIWLAMAKDIHQAKSIKEALGYVFQPPDWQSKAPPPLTQTLSL